jgi:eukaryotic-like serine/threonine-protein kinase
MQADPAQPFAPTAVGEGGRYMLRECLAHATAVSVYAAFDTRLSREVVVKVLKAAHGDADAHAVARAADLLANARLAARLQHPSVVTLFDAGLCGRDVYVVMERLEGDSLHDRLAAGWRPAPQEALRLGKRIAVALTFVHEAGVLHGRVEPSHVFLLGPTHLKLLNCGMASPSGEFDAAAVGAPGDASTESWLRYAAPEVLLGAAPDARCDVYGLGLVMYEMLARRAAFTGNSPEELRNGVLLSDVPEAHARNPAVPRTLSSIVARAMARDPAMRHPSMRELLNTLKNELAVTDPTGHTAGGSDRRRQAAAACAGWVAAGAVGFFAWRESAPPMSAADLTQTSARNTAPTAASTPALAPPVSVQPASSTPVLAESAAPNLATSTVRPLAHVREAAAASAARARATPSVPKTAAAPTRQTAPRPNPSSADQRSNPAPTAAAPSRQAETGAAAHPPIERVASPVAPADGGSSPAVAAARGAVVFAVEPGGAIEINGVQVGTTPPLRRLTLPNGKYEVTIRNDAFQPHVLSITVSADKPVNISHRFGS